MSHATLTGQERVSRMFKRQDQDRIPRHDSYWSETIKRWQSEGLQGDGGAVLRLLDGDFQQLCWSSPKPFPNREEVIEEDAHTRVTIDGFGEKIRQWKDRSGTPEHLGWECDSREAWQETFKPALLAAGLSVNLEWAKKTTRHGRELNRWCYLACVESFEFTRRLMGDEVTMIAMATEPDWVRDVSQTHTDLVLRDLQAMLDADFQPDGVWIYGDMAYNHATMCSPAMYRDLIWPDHQRIADWAHARNLPCIYHTDGDVNAVIDLYIQAGFDCLQPLEAKAHMDIRNLCPRFGDRLAFFGNIDVMVMATNDPRKVEQEVRSKLAAGMATKAYTYHSDHSVPPLVSWDTYQFIIQLLDRFGSYA